MKKQVEEPITKSLRKPFPLQTLRETIRKKLQGEVSISESLDILSAGNSKHASNVSSQQISSRLERLNNNYADYLVIGCSDARLPVLDSENDVEVGVQLRLAGNVVEDDFLLNSALSRLKKDGTVIVEGHCNCGAVAERNHWESSGKKPTGSKELDHLLHKVCSGTPEENAVEQLLRLEPLLNGRSALAVVYDWNKGEIVPLLRKGQSELWDVLKHRWEQYHKEHTDVEDLKTQKPHAIVVFPNNLPYSPHTIFNAEQNELFVVSGGEELTNSGLASILYAAEHLKTKHVVLLGLDKTFFSKWKSQISSLGLDLHITEATYQPNGTVLF